DAVQHRSGPTAHWRVHMFDRVCREHGIEHRFTKPNHPWTNGQVEHMNRTLKDATVRRYATPRQLEDHLAGFLDAYNFAKRLEPSRVCRRSQLLRGWGYDEQDDEQVLA